MRKAKRVRTPKLSLSVQVEALKQFLAASSAINAQLIIAKDKSELENKELRNDKRWLQTLVQELSAAINAGAREGNFPRR